MRGACGCTKWKAALHWMLFNIFKAITVRKCFVAMWNSYSCKIYNPQQVLFRCIKRKQCERFLFVLFRLFVCLLLLLFLTLTNLFPGEGEFDLKIFPRGWRFWYDLIRAFVKSPFLSRVWWGGGFNWLVHYVSSEYCFVQEKDRRWSSLLPEFCLASMMAYLHVKYVMDKMQVIINN